MVLRDLDDSISTRLQKNLADDLKAKDYCLNKLIEVCDRWSNECKNDLL